MRNEEMKTAPVTGLVLKMAIPTVLSMLVNSLYNIVDSFFVAQFSEKAMTAISLIFPLQNAVAAVSIGFGVGANVTTAFFLGTGDKKKSNGVASLSLDLSILHSVILAVIAILISQPFLAAFTKDATVLDYGIRYGRIVFGFTVFAQVGLVYEKLFQAVGRPTLTMVSLIAGCVTNIILDPLMIFGIGFPRMGIEGAAIATVIGQAVTLVIYLVCYAKGMLGLHLSLRDGIRARSYTGRIYSVGIPAILNQALPSVLITALNGILAGFGEAQVLILGVYYKLQTFIYLMANGIIQGIRPLISYNYGAGEPKRVREIVRTAWLFSLVVMGLGMALCLLIPENLMGLFVKNPTVVKQGAAALRIISMGFVISSVSVVVCGTMESLSLGIRSFWISMLRYVIVIIPAAWILSRAFGAVGVWNAFWVAEVITAVFSAWMYRVTMKKVLKQNTQGSRK